MDNKIPNHYLSVVKLIESQKSVHNRIKSVAAASEAMKRRSENFTRITRQMKTRTNQLEETQKILNRSANSLQYLEQHFADSINTSSEFIKRLEQSTKSYQKFVDNLERSSRIWEDRLVELSNATKNYLQFYREIEHTTQSLYEIYNNNDLNFKYKILQSGEIQIEDKIIDAETIDSFIYEINTSLEKSDNFAQFLNWLSTQFNNVKVPIKLFVLRFILPFIISIFATKVEPYIDIPFLRTNNPDDNKIGLRKRELNAHKSVDELQTFGVVSSKKVPVYSETDENSTVIGSLQFGRLISQIAVEGDWTLIEYFNPESEQYFKGWIYSDQIQQF